MKLIGSCGKVLEPSEMIQQDTVLHDQNDCFIIEMTGENLWVPAWCETYWRDGIPPYHLKQPLLETIRSGSYTELSTPFSLRANCHSLQQFCVWFIRKNPCQKKHWKVSDGDLVPWLNHDSVQQMGDYETNSFPDTQKLRLEFISQVGQKRDQHITTTGDATQKTQS